MSEGIVLAPGMEPEIEWRCSCGALNPQNAEECGSCGRDNPQEEM